MTTAITFQDVCHSSCFDNLSFEVETGSSTMIITSRIDENSALFQLMTGLLLPSGGQITVLGQSVPELGPVQLNQLRHSIGIVPANGGLVSNLKLWENITLPILYESGNISTELTEEAYNYLRKLNYSGNIMALPAHLTLYEKRMTAFIRGALKQSKLMIFSNCFDGTSAQLRKDFISAIHRFHQADQERTTLFLSSSADIAKELPIDRTISIH